MNSLTIILPAYQEAKRLPRTFELLKKAKAQGVFQEVNLERIWVIDDGSKDNTSEVAKLAQADLPELEVHRVNLNQGKGNAIHTGLRLSTTDWCLVADADSSTPWDQFKKLYLRTKKNGELTYLILIASRDLPGSDIQTEQSWIREHMGKTFNLLVRMITGLPFKDTQCGFKLIHRASIEPFLPLLIVKRFAWDVEFLMFSRAHAIPIAEIPVAWGHQDESRVNPVKDSFEMLFRVIQMRIRILFEKPK